MQIKHESLGIVVAILVIGALYFLMLKLTAGKGEPTGAAH